MQKSAILAILAKTSLFADLSPRDLNLLSEVVVHRKIAEETVFITEGEIGEEAYLILSGLTKVYKLSPEGKEVHIAFRTPTEIVGELALLDEGRRSAHVKTLRETEVLIVPKKDFVFLVKNNPTVAMGIIKALAKRIRENSYVLHDALSQQLIERMLSLLRQLAVHFPKHEITLSHEELANLLGATRPHITEILHKLEQRRLVKLSYKKIKLRPIVH